MKTLLLCAGVACAALAAGSPRAVRGEGSTSGELRAGGTARGDISRTPGEQDRIGIDLVAGSFLDVRLAAGFAAGVALLDPDGAPVEANWGAGKTRTLDGHAVSRSGRYEFAVASADGSQGMYTLTATASWERRLVLEGTAPIAFDVPMPAGSTLKGVVAPLQGASDVAIDALTAPDDSALAGPIAARGGAAKLPRTPCRQEGAYQLAVSAAGSGQFRATLVRRVPRAAATRLDLTNGLTIVSFEGDGVDRIFATRCSNCHSWARSYAGSRAWARQSLGKIRTGSMPKGGGRLSGGQIDLIEQWIRTGRNR